MQSRRTWWGFWFLAWVVSFGCWVKALSSESLFWLVASFPPLLMLLVFAIHDLAGRDSAGDEESFVLKSLDYEILYFLRSEGGRWEVEQHTKLIETLYYSVGASRVAVSDSLDRLVQRLLVTLELTPKAREHLSLHAGLETPGPGSADVSEA